MYMREKNVGKIRISILVDKNTSSLLNFFHPLNSTHTKWFLPMKAMSHLNDLNSPLPYSQLPNGFPFYNI